MLRRTNSFLQDHNWCKTNGKSVVNGDLYSILACLVKEMEDKFDVEIIFTWIPRKANTLADKLAKRAVDKIKLLQQLKFATIRVLGRLCLSLISQSFPDFASSREFLEKLERKCKDPVGDVQEIRIMLDTIEEFIAMVDE